MTKTIHITGMTCNNCKKHVEKALNALPGVQAEVDLENNLARVETDSTTSDEQMKAAIEEEGYGVTAIEG